LKYWLLTTEYPPFFGGGIGTYSSCTANMLAVKGHQISVFINDPSVRDIKTEEDINGVRIIRFNPSRTHSSESIGHITNICYEFANVVKRFIEEEGKPDVIESQEYLGIAYYLLQYKYLGYEWCSGIPVIVTMHSPTFLYMEYNHIPRYSYPNYWVCEMERFCLQAADLLISPSQFMLTELKKRFELNNPDVVVIPNPYSIPDHQKDKSKNEHRAEIVFYGKLTLQKGAFHLLNYFKELWDNGFIQPLYVIGGQDIIYHPEGKSMGDIIKKQYQKYITRGLLKLENKIRPSEIFQRLYNCEVAIIPSVNDNLPYVVFEMMGMGNIVLVSKQGGQSEIVENEINGFIFDHEHPETFARQLNRILSLTEEERLLVSKNAISKITSSYHPDYVYDKKMDAIKQLLGKAAKTDQQLFPYIRQLGVASEPGNLPSHKKDLLSIVVTFYNSGIYIDETIQCLEKIDYKNKEIIIVNDGSTDPVSNIKLEQYSNRNDIKIINKKNRGLAHTRNTGAEVAEGEFLSFLDADDKVDPRYYSKAITVLRKYKNVHFVGSWTQYFERSNAVWPGFNPEPPIILYHNTVNSAALVYKRSAYLTAGKNDYFMTSPGLEDYESVIAMLANGYRGVILPEPLFHYRVRPDSMVRAITTIKKQLIYEYISQKHKTFYGTFASEIFSLINANGPGLNIDNPSLDYDLAKRIPFGGKASLKLVRLIKYNKFVGAIAYRLYKLWKK
jgi:glycosyltransferase involved in cell wall biosynthesis